MNIYRFDSILGAGEEKSKKQFPADGRILKEKTTFPFHEHNHENKQSLCEFVSR
jgi:hypothetical protein